MNALKYYDILHTFFLHMYSFVCNLIIQKMLACLRERDVYKIRKQMQFQHVARMRIICVCVLYFYFCYLVQMKTINI